jgi:hypothetical protein
LFLRKLKFTENVVVAVVKMADYVISFSSIIIN